MSHLQPAKYNLILGSSSPRRKQLLDGLDLTYTIIAPDVDESFPATMPPDTVPAYLANLKADAIAATRWPSEIPEIIICADTVVIINGTILNKPSNKTEALAMLTLLNGTKHTVITAICIKTLTITTTLSDSCEVTFRNLSPSALNYYVDNYQPFDKAGAYGAQDWIGMAAIHSIEGSYFTVMGLPTHLLAIELEKYKDK